jgi:Methyltransferase domain
MQPEPDPDPVWVQLLSGAEERQCLQAIGEAQGDRRLFSHLAREHDREGRESYIEIDAPLELHALVRLLRPAHVVEVGVSSGVSSAYLLAAMEKNGKGTLHSVDLPSRPRRGANGDAGPRMSWSLPPGRSPGWAVPPRLWTRWDLRLGDKAAALPILAAQLPRVDLLVYDVPHEDAATRKEFRLLDPLFPPGGVAIVDHGPGGGQCAALRGWGQDRHARPVRRAGLGLYGARLLARRRVPHHRPPNGLGVHRGP